MGHLKIAYYLNLAHSKGLVVEKNKFSKGWTITLLSGYKIVCCNDDEMARAVKGV